MMKKHLFLAWLAKNHYFCHLNSLRIKGEISPFFARVRKSENKFLICEKLEMSNILDLRAL